MPSQLDIKNFQEKIWRFYQASGRHHLPWRNTFNPYAVLVSEMMLQQTQVERVKPKYREFLAQFPTIKTLAAASPSEVIKAWQGLGYNRRALFLQRTAKIITNKFSGKLPQNYEQLLTLPGIGQSTAGALLAFAFNQPVVFVETNLRRAVIHEFYADEKPVDDKDVFIILKASVDTARPREWYWALMDYGSALGREKGLANPNRQSRRYTRQSKFSGSFREIRGRLLRLLAEGSQPRTKLKNLAPGQRALLDRAIAQLEAEKFIEKKGNHFQLNQRTD